MPLVFIDTEGLAPYAPHETQTAVADLCRLEYPDAEFIIGDGGRLDLLNRLVSGAGVRVVTGPVGRDYWGRVSREVQVTVWPDGYDWKERAADEWDWALGQTGAQALYKSHAAKGKQPTVRHKLFREWCLARQLRDLCLAAQDVVPLVHEDTPFDLIGIDDGLDLLRSQLLLVPPAPLALDWEWHRETKESVGIAISASERNTYVPVRASDVDRAVRQSDLRRAFGDYLRQGGRGVLHGGRADLGTQLECDPVDLLTDGKYVADDTMVMAYLLGETALGLKPLSRKYLGRDPIENDREWADETARFTARYAAAGDTRNTYDLYVELDGRLRSMGREGRAEEDRSPSSQYTVYETIERPLVPVIASMEKYGTPVSISAVLRSYGDHVRVEAGLRAAVAQLYGRDLSSDSETLGFIADCGFTNPGTLDQRVISLNPHWCVDLILEYRRTRTRRRNFLKRVLQRWVESGKPNDFRVYPRFNQAGAMDPDGPAAPRTGRLSSADPNLMNQPHAIRDIYVPPPGCVWWSYDYSGLELRIAAGLSQDPVMLGALQEGRDLHGEFQKFIQLKTGRDVGRVPAKTGNFEQLYEGGANQLVRILAKQRAFISGEDAQAIVDSHHQLFARYHEWGAERVRDARRTGYATTHYGRLRRITEYDSSDAGDIGHGDRAAQNHPVQGTGADVVKGKMVEIQPLLAKFRDKVLERMLGGPSCHMSLQVHDELDGWLPEGVDLAEFDGEMKRILQDVNINGLPLLVAGGFGKNWSEAH